MSSPELAKTLMIQGTTSSAGKTTVAAGLCRLLRQDGHDVAPFKGWNMSLNAGVTPDGGEIGRGQIMQAIASGIEATVDMNPVLVKPHAGGTSQTIIRGKVTSPEELQAYREEGGLFGVIRESLGIVRLQHNVVVIEGSGSPAEPNLMQYDIANMRVAKEVQSPVLLVANIDPSGAYASLLGTIEILRDKDPHGLSLVKGLVVNKFRGKSDDLREANEYITARTGIPVIGVLPYLRDLALDDEDSMELDNKVQDLKTVIDVAIPRFPTLSNTDDYTALRREAGVNVRYLEGVEDFGKPDLVILGGSKQTMQDLQWLEETGIAAQVKEYANKNGAIIGICGGFQMLGRTLSDPNQVETRLSYVRGLGLLPADTVFEQQKITRQAAATIQADNGLLQGTTNMEAQGYEIHNGETTLDGKPIMTLIRQSEEVATPDGSSSLDGWIIGTYLHGLLNNQPVRRQILQNIANRKGMQLPDQGSVVLDPYNLMAETIRQNLDMNFILRLLDEQQ